MAPVTELATIPLMPGAQIEDPTSPAGQVWQSTISTISSQPGFQRAHWGRKLENESVLQLFIDWDSLSHHQDFVSSPSYPPFAKAIATIADGSTSKPHANLTPHPATAALGPASPVTEVLTCYVEKEHPDFESKYKQMLKVLSDNAEGFKAASGGWMIEDVEYEGKKDAKAYVALLGWESKEAHEAFRETQLFKDNIYLLRDNTLGMELHHTKFVER